MNFDKLVYNIKKSYSEARIQKSKERLTRAWNLEKPEDKIPFVFTKFPDGSNVNDDRLLETGYGFEEELYYQLFQMEKRAILEDDYIPSLFPGLRQSAIPSAFGANEEKKGEHFWSNPVINDPKEVYKLEKPDFNKKNTPAWRILENIKYFRKMTKGQLPIRGSDMQGPMAAASIMWGLNNYLLAFYNNPEEVHFLHKILTEAFIEFLDLQIEASEGDFIPAHADFCVWMPPGKGIGVCNDLLAVVGPKQLQEFSIPYDNRISDYYSGIVIHSCGKINHNLEELKKLKEFKSINFGSTETNIEDIIRVFGKSLLYITYASDVATSPRKVESQEDFIKRISKTIKEENISAQIEIITPKEYTAEETLRLNDLASKYFKIL